MDLYNENGVSPERIAIWDREIRDGVEGVDVNPKAETDYMVYQSK